MSIRDIQAILMIALAVFMGMGLYSMVATFVATRKKVILWAYKKGLKIGAEMAEETEEFLK